MTVSQAARSSSTPRSAAWRRRVPSNLNGVVTMPDGQRAELARDPRDDRCGAGAGAAALAGRDEDHVRAAQRRADLVVRLLGGARGRSPDRRPSRGRASPLADVDLRRRVRERELLESVLTATKSTCAMPASIIRWTAFRPAPPTPTTRITARYAAPFGRRHAVQARRALGHRLEEAAAGGRRDARRATSDRSRSDRRSAPDLERRLRRRLGAASARGLAGGDDRSRLVEVVDVLDGLLERRLVRAVWLGRLAPRPAAPPRRPPARAARPRSHGRARPAGPHACSRACAPWSTSFASSRYACGGRARRVVLEHGAPLHGRLGVADGLADPRLVDEVAEVLLEDLDRLSRVQRAPVVHGRDDALDARRAG